MISHAWTTKMYRLSWVLQNICREKRGKIIEDVGSKDQIKRRSKCSLAAPHGHTLPSQSGLVVPSVAIDLIGPSLSKSMSHPSADRCPR